MLSPALMIGPAVPAATRPGAETQGQPAGGESATAFSSALADADGARQLASTAVSDSTHKGNAVERAQRAQRRDGVTLDDTPAGADGKEVALPEANELAAAADSVAQAQQSLVDVAAMLASLQGPPLAPAAAPRDTAPPADVAALAAAAMNGGAALIDKDRAGVTVDTRSDARVDTKASAAAPTLASGPAAHAAETTMLELLSTAASDGKRGSSNMIGNGGATPSSEPASAGAVATPGADPATALATAAGQASAVAGPASATSATPTAAATASAFDASEYQARERPAGASEPRIGAVNADGRGRAAASARDRGDTTSASAATRTSAGELRSANTDREVPGRSEAVAPSSSYEYTLPLPGAPTAGAPRANVSAQAPGADLPFQAQLSAALNSPEFAPALGVQLSMLTRNGIPEARLHLNPAELGPIAVQIELDGRSAQVVLAASHADTRQALEQAMPQLASALRDAGFTMTGGGVFQQPQQRPAPGTGPQTRGSGRTIEGEQRVDRARVQQGVVDLYA